jgi:hypothetical protein
VVGTTAGLGMPATTVRFIAKYRIERAPARLCGLLRFGRSERLRTSGHFARGKMMPTAIATDVIEVEIRPVARPAGAEPQQVRLTMPGWRRSGGSVPSSARRRAP